MEKFNNTLLEDWVNNDPKLLELLNKIDSQADTDMERAKIAFHKLAEVYSLPKYPDDGNDDMQDEEKDSDFQDRISMYEALGKIKFGDPNPLNIKSHVLLAAYAAKNNFEPLFDEELENYLGGDELVGLGFKGKDIDVEMIPIKKGESWFDKGCTLFIKSI